MLGINLLIRHNSSHCLRTLGKNFLRRIPPKGRFPYNGTCLIFPCCSFRKKMPRCCLWSVLMFLLYRNFKARVKVNIFMLFLKANSNYKFAAETWHLFSLWRKRGGVRCWYVTVMRCKMEAFIGWLDTHSSLKGLEQNLYEFSIRLECHSWNLISH